MKQEIIKAITDFIFIEDIPQKSDIILMPGGSHPELGEKAAELWHGGFAPIVFVSGGVSVKTGKFPGAKSKTDIYDGDYSTDCEFLTDVLVKNGVASSAILGEDKSGYTKQNALYTRAALDELQIYPKSAIVVCKAFHARRCQMCYQLAFPDTHLYIVTVAGFGITRNNWYESEYGITRVMGELSRCGQQFTREWIEELRRGSNTMEIWDAYDKNENKLGFNLYRDKPVPKNVYHLVVENYVFSRSGKVLVTQRAANKSWSLKWENQGGSALKDETPIQAAIRELREETGISVDESQLRFAYTEIREPSIYKCFVVLIDGNEKITLQEGETVDYKWLTYEEYLAFIKTDKFVGKVANSVLEHIGDIEKCLKEIQ